MSTFLVTGASRGLGRAVVVAALAAGHRVVTGVRDPHALDDLLTALPGDDGGSARLVVVPLEVTDRAQAERAVHTVVDRFGRLDVLVNNAGYANVSSIEDAGPADFRAQVDTNLFGVVNLTQAALPVLREERGGHVVQVWSVGGRMASPGLGAYQTAKWAVGGFSSVLAAEVAPLGIKVTVLEPGGMQTDWAGSSMSVPPISEPYSPTVGRAAAMHNAETLALGDPGKVAQVVLQVASMDDPPLRLILGSEAYACAPAAPRAQAESDERWHDLTVSPNRDDATDADRDPLGA